MRAVLACALAGALTLDAATAAACSLFGNERFTPDANGSTDDHTPPGDVTAEWRVEESEGGGSCDPLTTLLLDVTATDDRAPSTALGYLVRVVEGELKNPHPFSEEPVRVGLAGSLVYYFRGGEDLALTLEISAVDENNNVGPPTLVEIEHESGGCSAASPDVAFASMLAPLALVLRRRRKITAYGRSARRRAASCAGCS